MKFLVDANLPPSLAAWLRTQAHEAVHVNDLGLGQAKDRLIWAHAKAEGSCIVTRDEDFVLLSVSNPDGPSVVWVRIGNAVRRVLLQRSASIWPEVVDKLEQGVKVVEVQ